MWVFPASDGSLPRYVRVAYLHVLRSPRQAQFDGDAYFDLGNYWDSPHPRFLKRGCLLR